MNCPNCTEALTECVTEEFWEDLCRKVPEHTFEHDNTTLRTYSIIDLKSKEDPYYSTWACPHCYCIVLRCEE